MVVQSALGYNETNYYGLLQQIRTGVVNNQPLMNLEGVRLVRDIPDHGLRKGRVGTIILVHEVPSEAYEVEFTGPSGRPDAIVVLERKDVERVGPEARRDHH